MNLRHRLEMSAGLMLAKVGRKPYREDGALTTEMMLLTAALTIVAAGAFLLLRARMTSAANNIVTDPNTN